MPSKIYAVGDAITLKADLYRSTHSDRTCTIVAVLPVDRGEAQYRVRMGKETFERRIVASDIEASEPTGEKNPAGKTAAPALCRQEPWLRPLNIRTAR